MKKISLLVFIVCAILLVSGCDKKQVLRCTNSEKTTGMTIETDVNTVFLNNEFDNVNMKMKVTVTESYKQYMDTIKNSLESQYKKYKNEKGFDYKISIKDNVINFEMLLNNNQISSETKKDLGFSGREDYKTNKKALEQKGYKCK